MFNIKGCPITDLKKIKKIIKKPKLIQYTTLTHYYL